MTSSSVYTRHTSALSWGEMDGSTLLVHAVEYMACNRVIAKDTTT